MAGEKKKMCHRQSATNEADIKDWYHRAIETCTSVQHFVWFSFFIALSLKASFYGQH